MTQVFLGLGSNIPPRLDTLNSAVEALDQIPGTLVKAVSFVYQTEAVAPMPQSPYLNLAVCLETALSPNALLEQCQQIEQANGRPLLRPKNEPRTLDIDIIFFGTTLRESHELKLPHARYAERRFVLEPLAQIAPDFVCPDSGISVKETLAQCDDPFTVRLLVVESA